MTVFIFGNPDVAIDSLPLRILDRLREALLDVDFQVKDPNEEWEVPDELIVIDTVIGIKDIHVFNSLDEFQDSPRITPHDYDALFNLKFLQKLGKLKKIKIIGLSPTISENRALEEIKKILHPS